MSGAKAQDLALRADENLRAFSSAWARACGGGVWTNGDVLAATSGTGSRAYNQAFVLRQPADPLRSFTEARKHLDALGVKSRLRALEALDIDESVLAAAGLVRDGGIPTLALHPIDDTPSGPDNDVRPVDSEAMLAVLVELVAATFEFPPGILARVFTPALLANPSWHGYIAYVDGTSAATSTLFVHERVAGIYYVGTLAQYRKQGLGEAVTRRCVIDGFGLGCDMASLQASPEGRPIYERMGFQHVGYYRTYIPTE
jgi:ribosomal protein S18 acetylase RimI-like enzyme